MMKSKFIRLSVLIFLLILCRNESTWTQIRLNPDNSSISISGTSSLHDWHEKVNPFTVELGFRYGKDNTISGIDKVIFKCKTTSVVSDNSLMTSKTHEALQADKFPEITFVLFSVDNFTLKDGKLSGSLTGDMRIAGVNRRISLTYTGNVQGNKINIKGSEVINMSDYKIKPPTAILGTLKTGEVVTIGFNLEFITTGALTYYKNH